MSQFDPTSGKIVELENRVKVLEEATVQLTDSILKLEKLLDQIASYIIPEEEKEKQ